MNGERLDVLIEAWCDDCLSDEQTELLNRLLRESDEARRRFADESRLHGLLHCAVAEEAVQRVAAAPTDSEDPAAQSRRMWSGVAIALCGLAAGVVIAVVGWERAGSLATATKPDPSIRVAEVRYAEDADFVVPARSPDHTIGVGSRLGPGVYQLKRGFVELDFYGGAVVALQAPAEIELRSQREARLLNGRLTVEAGDSERSFLLHTPAGEVVDIGTRYGVFVDASGFTETHVFEGLVDIRQKKPRESVHRLEADSAVRITTSGVAESLSVTESAFPQASRKIAGMLRHGDFEPGTRLHVGRAKFGQWGGDICRVVGDSQGIRPSSGEGMLLFQSTGQNPQAGRDSTTAASQLSQWIDLTPYRAAIAEGRVRAKLSARFNRVAGDEKTDSQFTIHIESFGVAPEEAVRQQKARPRAPRSRVSYDLLSDGKPESWESAEAVLALPPNALYLEATVFAFENVSNDQDASREFDGHFADDLQFELLIEPAGSEMNGEK